MLTIKNKIMIIHILMIVMFYHCGRVSTQQEFVYNTRIYPDEGMCKYEGYVPGGNKIDISPIQAPTAKIETDMLGKILTFDGNADAMAAVETVIGIGKNAPVLGPALESFGGFFGIAADYKTATPQEILDATNKAIEKLTTEVNERFNDMKDYVDQETMNVVKERINVEYKHMVQIFANCIEEVSLELAIECQEDASRYIRSGFSKFMLFKGKLGKYNESSPPTTKEVKKMELTFLSFREYVTLDLMQLEVLKNTFRDNKLLKYRNEKYKKHLRELSKDVDIFIKYAKSISKWILFKHTTKICDATKKYWSHVKNKHFPYSNRVIYQLVDVTVECQYDAMKKNHCKTKSLITTATHPRGGGFVPIKYKHWDADMSARAITRIRLDKGAESYSDQVTKAVKNYWEAEILSSLSTWQKFKDQADNELSKLNDDIRMEYNIEVPQYFSILQRADDPENNYHMMNNANDNKVDYQYDEDRSKFSGSSDFEYPKTHDEIVDRFPANGAAPLSPLEKYKDARNHMMLLEDMPLSARFKERYLRAFDTLKYFKERQY